MLLAHCLSILLLNPLSLLGLINNPYPQKDAPPLLIALILWMTLPFTTHSPSGQLLLT